MRAYFLFLLIFFGNFLQAQQLFLALPVEVAPAPSTSGQRPRIHLLHDSIPLVAFGKTGSDPALFVSRWNGNGFNAPLRITSPLTMPLVSMVDGPEIKSFGDTVFLIYADHTTAGGVILFRSYNGGISFPDSTNVYNNINDHCEFGDLTLLSGSEVVVSFLRADLAFTTIEMLSARSVDGGASFSTPVNASSVNPGLPCECCPSSILHRGNDVFLAYRNDISDTREFYLSVSHNGGLTYTTGIKIDSSNYNSLSCPTNGVKLFLNGDTLYASYGQKPFGATYMNVYGSSINVNDYLVGPLFTAEPVLPNANQFRPVMTGNNDTLFMLWQDSRAGNLDVYVSYKIGNTPFSNAIKVSHVNPMAQTDVDAVYKNGILHITWLDQSSQKVFYGRGSFSEFTNLNEVSKSNHIELFPNPAQDVLYIRTENKIKSVEIYDAMGRVLPMKNESYSEEINIPLNGFSSGMYWISIVLESGERFQKTFVRY